MRHLRVTYRGRVGMRDHPLQHIHTTNYAVSTHPQKNSNSVHMRSHPRRNSIRNHGRNDSPKPHASYPNAAWQSCNMTLAWRTPGECTVSDRLWPGLDGHRRQGGREAPVVTRPMSWKRIRFERKPGLRKNSSPGHPPRSSHTAGRETEQRVLVMHLFGGSAWCHW